MWIFHSYVELPEGKFTASDGILRNPGQTAGHGEGGQGGAGPVTLWFSAPLFFERSMVNLWKISSDLSKSTKNSWAISHDGSMVLVYMLTLGGGFC
jgi:hypothetical protein